MRILVLSACFPPSRGGVERCVHELTKRLASKGYKMVVSTQVRTNGAPLEEKTSNGVEVFRFHVKSYLLEMPFGFGTAFEVLRQDFDVLHAHGMTPGVTDLGVFFAKLRGKRVVLTYHNDAETFQNGVWGKIATQLYVNLSILVTAISDVVISSTESYASTSPTLSRFKQKLKIIPMGVDFKKFQKPLHNNNNSQNRKNLLFVGQIRKYKGIDTLIDAFKMVSSEYKNGINLTIVGIGPELDSLKAKANDIGVNESILFTGGVSDEILEEYYRSSDLLILPSIGRREAFGIVLLEAMSAGKPVIASDIPGVSEIVNAGGGVLVEPGKPRALADAILNLIKDERKYQSISEQSRRAASAFDWDIIADRYEKVFKKIAK